jgi:uncharacterized membrane protein
LIPDFAERREVVGEWYVAGTTLVNSKPEETKRAHDITRMFSSTSPDQVLSISSKYGIGYIYIGACEQEMYPRILTVLRADTSSFKAIYGKDGVYIFQRSASGKEISSGAAFEPAR